MKNQKQPLGCYFDRVLECSSRSLQSETSKLRLRSLADMIYHSDQSETQVLYTNGKDRNTFHSARALLDCVANYPASAAVCVIENISPSDIETLGTAWDLDPNFFIGHAQNPHPDKFWAHPFRALDQSDCLYRHLDGVFEYPGTPITKLLSSAPNYFSRNCAPVTPLKTQSNTHISYYRVNEKLYLFLVDAPIAAIQHTSSQFKTTPNLRFQYSANRGGILVPKLFNQTKFTLFGTLEAVFQHEWQLDLLFSCNERTMPEQPLLYLFVNSIWRNNLLYISLEGHRLSFEEIHKPSLETNNVLHNRREQLAFMRLCVDETIKYAPVTAVEYYRNHKYYAPNKARQWKVATPVEQLQETLDSVLQLNQFLLETFQLLMTSISVRDSQLSIEQSQRATRLTQLAFIYVPLSFVTGVFGMNIQQINGTGLSIWVCFATLAVTIVLTAGIFWLIHERPRVTVALSGLLATPRRMMSKSE